MRWFRRRPEPTEQIPEIYVALRLALIGRKVGINTATWASVWLETEGMAASTALMDSLPVDLFQAPPLPGEEAYA